MNRKLPCILFLFSLIIISCKEKNLIPKPKAMLRLEYPPSKEVQLETDNFVFNYNQQALPIIKNQSAIVLNYSSMKGSIFITYKKVDGNLEKLIVDAEKLSLEHMKKADNIDARTFINQEHKVYGTYFQIIGNAASQAQFYLTDSIHNFMTGSLYFSTKPNFDSILPAADYLQSDMRVIMETLRWKS